MELAKHLRYSNNAGVSVMLAQYHAQCVKSLSLNDNVLLCIVSVHRHTRQCTRYSSGIWLSLVLPRYILRENFKEVTTLKSRN
jgi:hypothetical protein